LRSETVPAPAEIAGKLEMAEREELALLERLRLADDDGVHRAA
jgi:DNA-binding GntR family transcriptional regulator